MATKKLKFTRRPRTIGDIVMDLNVAKLQLLAASEEGNWDRADRLQLRLDALQDEAIALSVSRLNATTQGTAK